MIPDAGTPARRVRRDRGRSPDDSVEPLGAERGIITKVEADPHPAPPQPARAFIPVLAKPRTAVINTSQHNPARGRAAGLPTLAILAHRKVRALIDFGQPVALLLAAIPRVRAGQPIPPTPQY